MSISEEIVSHTIETGDIKGASGGDIIHVTDLLEQLLIKQVSISHTNQDCNQSLWKGLKMNIQLHLIQPTDSTTIRIGEYR